MVWIAIALGPVAWVVAAILGGYRQHCILSEWKYHGVNTPLIWLRSGFRYGTWVVVCVLPLVSAAVFAEMALRAFPPLVASLVFGSSLFLRFAGSAILAALYERKVGPEGFPSLWEQQREEEQGNQLRRLAARLREAADKEARLQLLSGWKRRQGESAAVPAIRLDTRGRRGL
jgi:hypothetical protein